MRPDYPYLSRLARKVRYYTQMVHTGHRLFKKVTSRPQLATMAVKAAMGEGLVLPNSKYIGPFNPMDKGKPESITDAHAYQHDIDYDDYIRHGVAAEKVYSSYSDADERLKNKAYQHMHRDPNAMAAWAGMKTKELLYQTGFIPKLDDFKVYGASKKPSQPNPHQANSNQYRKMKYTMTAHDIHWDLHKNMRIYST
jgi:hypothetical protein